MESESGLDRNAALADMRYTFIEAAVARTVVKPPRKPRPHPQPEDGSGAHRQIFRHARCFC